MRSVRNTARNLGTKARIWQWLVKNISINDCTSLPNLSGGHLVTAIYRLMLSLLMAEKIIESKRLLHPRHLPILTDFQLRCVLFSLLEAVRLDPSSTMNWHNNI